MVSKLRFIWKQTVDATSAVTARDEGRQQPQGVAAAIMLVGPPFSDEWLFGVAAALEVALQTDAIASHTHVDNQDDDDADKQQEKYKGLADPHMAVVLAAVAAIEAQQQQQQQKEVRVRVQLIGHL